MLVTFYRRNHPGVFCKTGALKNFEQFTGKHLCWSHFLIKLQAWRHTILLKSDSSKGVFCEFCENCKNIYFIYFVKRLRAAAFGVNLCVMQNLHVDIVTYRWWKNHLKITMKPFVTEKGLLDWCRAVNNANCFGKLFCKTPVKV